MLQKHGSNNFIRREVFQIVGSYVRHSAPANEAQSSYECHQDIEDESIQIITSYGALRELNLPEGSKVEARFYNFAG